MKKCCKKTLQELADNMACHNKFNPFHDRLNDSGFYVKGCIICQEKIKSKEQK